MDALRRYFFRPRMLRDMSNGSLKTSYLGLPSELPIYIAPAAMAKMGHPLGEVNLTKAAGQHGIIQSVSQVLSRSTLIRLMMNLDLCKHELLIGRDFRGQNGVSGLILSGLCSPGCKPFRVLSYTSQQIYIDKKREVTAELLRHVESLGVKAIIFTVDVGWWSKRTIEARVNKPLPKEFLGAFMASGGEQDRNLSWDDIAWIRVGIHGTLISNSMLRTGSVTQSFRSL